MLGKVRVKGLIKGDEVAKHGGKRGPLKQEVTETEVMEGGGERFNNTLRNITIGIKAEVRYSFCTKVLENAQ